MTRFFTHSLIRYFLVALWLSTGALMATGCGGEDDQPAPDQATASHEVDEAVSPDEATGLGEEEELAPTEGEAEALLAAAPQPPAGSWPATCSNYDRSQLPERFCATCRNGRGGTGQSCITRTACLNWTAWNNNGVLTCSPIDTVRELVVALASAKEGMQVYVSDNAALDLGGRTLRVPAGVTLASGRWKGKRGANLFTTVTAKREPLITTPSGQRVVGPLIMAGDGARITGLRIQGPDDARRDRLASAEKDAIQAEPGTRGVTVEYSELWGWPHAAVYLVGSQATVSYNDIHDNTRAGSGGYGVCLNKGSKATVDHNHFIHVVHGVAGTGHPDIDYVAAYNVFKDNIWQALDMHGIYEPDPDTIKDNWAGQTITIHHNTFLNPRQPAVMIRGIPSKVATVHDNCFPHRDPGAAVKQRLRGAFLAHYEHIDVGPNSYDQPAGTCHLQR